MISSLQTDILFGLPGVYLILGFQFRSYIQPLTVMLAIPTGIVVNDSILLVAFIKQRLREGMGAVAAAQTAAKERFRAIILTSLTTIAGMTPCCWRPAPRPSFSFPWSPASHSVSSRPRFCRCFWCRRSVWFLMI